MCKACKTRNLKRNQGFWKQFWPPRAKDANNNRRHLGAEARQWQIHGGARRNPTGRDDGHSEVRLFLWPCLHSLQSALSTQGLGGGLSPHAGLLRTGCEWGVEGARVQGHSLGRQLRLRRLQFLFTDDKMFRNSQPGVCKHLWPFERPG